MDVKLIGDSINWFSCTSSRSNVSDFDYINTTIREHIIPKRKKGCKESIATK